MRKLLLHPEHFKGPLDVESGDLSNLAYAYNFKKRRGEQSCYSIVKGQLSFDCELSYFIGVDWVVENEVALYVYPKLDQRYQKTDYLGMLSTVFEHPDVAEETEELFEIKFDVPSIEIAQEQDMITPLVIIQFLNVVEKLVRKGLKRSYYTVTSNLFAKVKGKVLVSGTVKHNVLRNRPLHTMCSYEEFGLNNLENRLLKKALLFVRQYVQTIKVTKLQDHTNEQLNYIYPAFESVDETLDLDKMKAGPVNVFYKEYDQAIYLAKVILRRFGYSINNIEDSTQVRTPPFWIDMSKLFELYVLSLLRRRFRDVKELKYQFGNRGSKLDFLLNSAHYKMVVDAKYKTMYSRNVDHNDVRQVSGYARLKKVYNTLKVKEDTLIDCLFVYPDQEKGFEQLPADLKGVPIEEYAGVYKVAVKLPIL